MITCRFFFEKIHYDSIQWSCSGCRHSHSSMKNSCKCSLMCVACGSTWCRSLRAVSTQQLCPNAGKCLTKGNSVSIKRDRIVLIENTRPGQIYLASSKHSEKSNLARAKSKSVIGWPQPKYPIILWLGFQKPRHIFPSALGHGQIQINHLQIMVPNFYKWLGFWKPRRNFQ